MTLPLFVKRTAIGSSGLLKGFTDYHSHILPGVDDGVKTLEDSLNILQLYEEAGIHTLWLTPHIMEDIPNTTAHLKQVFAQLRAAYNGPIELMLGSENMLDSLFAERLQEGDFLPVYENRLLVETSFFNPPCELASLLKQIISAGYFPLMAHPERYMYMDPEQYRQLQRMNVKFQLNLPSLYGAYGPEVQSKAEWLLKEGFYEVCGTDLHREVSFEHLKSAKVRQSILRQLPR